MTFCYVSLLEEESHEAYRLFATVLSPYRRLLVLGPAPAKDPAPPPRPPSRSPSCSTPATAWTA